MEELAARGPRIGEAYYVYLARIKGHPDWGTPMMATWRGTRWALGEDLH